MIKKEFNEIKVPENLDVIIDETIDKVYKKKVNRTAKKVWAGVAASVALFMVVGVAKPTIASKIPPLQSAFEEIQGKIGFSGKYTDYAISINKSVQNNGVEVTLSEILCDGQSLYVSYIVESEEAFKQQEYDILERQLLYEGSGKVSFTNEALDNGGTAGIEGKFIDDNTFVGVEKYNLQFLGRDSGEKVEIPEKFEFEILLKSFRAIPAIGDDKEELMRKGQWGFKVNVDVDKSISKKIEINSKSNSGVEIKDIIVTPFEINVTTEHSENNYSNYNVSITDENNNELERAYQSWEESTSTSNFAKEDFDGDKLIINILNNEDELIYSEVININ